MPQKFQIRKCGHGFYYSFFLSNKRGPKNFFLKIINVDPRLFDSIEYLFDLKISMLKKEFKFWREF